MRRREAQKGIPAKKVSSLASFVAGLLISITLLSPLSFSIQISQEGAIAVATSPQIALAADPAPADDSENLISKHYCKGSDPSTWGGCLVGIFIGIIYGASAQILTLGGLIFDLMLGFSLSHAVLNAPFAQNGWAVTRDLANMLFIFILLFIAIATILQISSYGAKSLLARLVIIALLLNFSLFITRVVVDVSNVTARLFYNGISGGAATANVLDGEKTALTASAFSGKNFDAPPKSISVGLIASFNPQKLISVDSFKEWADEGKGMGTLFFIYLFATGINIVAAWILISIALLFVVRVAVIWFLMAVAPLAFIAMILPNTKSWASRWWSELFSKSFSIAVFLFFLWIIAAFTSSPFLTDTFKTAVSSDVGIFKIVVIVALQFSVLIVMLLIAKKTTTSMAGSIGGMSLAIGNKLAGGALGLLAGGVGGRLARGFIGRGGAMMAGSEGLRNMEEKGGALGWGARRMLLAGDAVSKKSFDIRNVPAVQKAMGSIDAGLGKGGGKGGYEAILKSQVERRTKIGELIGASTLKERENAQAPRSRMQAYDKAIAAEKARDPNSSTLKAMILERAHEEAEMKMWEEKGARRKEGFAQTLATKGSATPLGLLRRAVGKRPSIADREGALALRKGQKTVQQLVSEALKTSGEVKEEPSEKPAPSASDKKEGAKEGKSESKENFTT